MHRRGRKPLDIRRKIKDINARTRRDLCQPIEPRRSGVSAKADIRPAATVVDRRKPRSRPIFFALWAIQHRSSVGSAHPLSNGENGDVPGLLRPLRARRYTLSQQPYTQVARSILPPIPEVASMSWSGFDFRREFELFSNNQNA